MDEYSWDYHNRLTAIITKDSGGAVIKTAEYTYDAYDRRIEKVVDQDGDGPDGAVTEAYVYDGDHIALVFDGDGNLTHRYLHGPQIDQVLAEETADGEVRWALADNQGTVRDIIDNDGNVINHISYDSFGQITEQTNPTAFFRFGYTGREFDQESGQYFYRARYFDPGVGRFISEDPIGFRSGDANLYRYVGNNSLNLIDPDGKEPVKQYAGTLSDFLYTINVISSRKVGLFKGKEAHEYMRSLDNYNWQDFKPVPTQTGFFNDKKGRYIYTEQGGWIDMSHFLFYAGRAYNNKIRGMPKPCEHAVKDGYNQELFDGLSAPHSAYSYEDLPSDKFGADFGANHFDPTSDLNLQQQLRNYLKYELKATSPQKAPNFSRMPMFDSKNLPSRINKTTEPVFVQGDSFSRYPWEAPKNGRGRRGPR